MKRIIITLIVVIMSVGIVCAQNNTIKHIVKKGETLESIAQSYHTTAAKIIKLNPNAAQFVYVGMELQIPQVEKKTQTEKAPATTRSVSKVNLDSPALQFGNPNRDNYSMFLAVQANIGYCNFICERVNVHGSMLFGAEAQFQFLSNYKFLKGYYLQAGIGYQCLGAADFRMHYFQIRTLPFGYNYHFTKDIGILGTAGIYMGVPFNRLMSSKKSFKANVDVGLDCGVAVEYKVFTMGINFQYGFLEVAPSTPVVSLHNFGTYITFAYKFCQF